MTAACDRAEGLFVYGEKAVQLIVLHIIIPLPAALPVKLYLQKQLRAPHDRGL